ncbi:hypothetical protein B0H14DRAFT_2606420 [Mycena olivaceomarginata]|nr:hypothetical protein B0H14DRAFT_2606420 [Mycena olivaceomarginata]
MVLTAWQLLALGLVTTCVEHVRAGPAQTTVPVVTIVGDQTATAAILGVDSQGRTLVEGSDHVFFTFSHTIGQETFVDGYDCGLVNGGAVCSGTGVDSDTPLTTSTVTSLGFYVLDIVSTAAPSTPTSPGSNSPINTGLAGTPPSATRNSSLKIAGSISGAFMGLAVVAYGLL